MFRVYDFVCVEGIVMRLAGPLRSIFSSAADLTAPLSLSVPIGLKIWTFTFWTQMLTLTRHVRTQTHILFSNNYSV